MYCQFLDLPLHNLKKFSINLIEKNLEQTVKIEIDQPFTYDQEFEETIKTLQRFEFRMELIRDQPKPFTDQIKSERNMNDFTKAISFAIIKQIAHEKGIRVEHHH